MHFDKDLRLIYLTEVTKKDILGGLGNVSKNYANFGKPADVFTIHASGDYDYDKDVTIPVQVTVLEWRSLPFSLRQSRQFQNIKSDVPGLFYSADESSFELYITDPYLKEILRESFFADYPSTLSTNVRNILVRTKVIEDWIVANAFDAED